MENIVAIPATVVSINDAVPLHCVICFQRSAVEKASNLLRCAVVAHPYAPLGGTSDDPVVALVADTLISKGFIVATFNFRGAGVSGGRTSWTSKPELEDYLTIVGFLSRFCASLLHHGGVSEQKRLVNANKIKIILGGYSYGSMIARQVESAQVIFDAFVPDVPSPLGNIAIQAQELAIRYKNERSPESSMSIDTHRDLEPPSHVDTAYLLISPLLSPVASILALSLSNLISKNKREQEDLQRLTSHYTLALSGTDDIFTSSARLHSWASNLFNEPDSRFTFRQIDGAGHFWREDGVRELLRDSIRDWVKGF